jgi:PAS domain S-box-containing protein
MQDDRSAPATDADALRPPWLEGGEDAVAALDESRAQLEVLTDAMPQMVWSTRPDGFHDYYNARWYEFTGVPVGSTDGEGWNGMFHPEDQERAWASWRRCLATGEPYEIEYRLRHHSGAYRWTLGRALPVRNADGEIVRWIGTCTDIDAAKKAAEQNELLNRELAHRIKNIFAVVSGLIGISSRHDPTIRPYAKSLQERIAALGRAHEFARPHSDASRPALGGTTLKGLLQELFRPYPAFDAGDIRISGDDTTVDDRGATPIAMLFHELATNAAKYGALSAEAGRIGVDVSVSDGTVRIVWQEDGGPPVDGEPQQVGFGTRLAQLSVEQQLGGKLERFWRRGGLRVEVTVLAERLHRT